MRMNNTVSTAAATTSQNDRGTNQTPAFTQTKGITLTLSSTAAQSRDTEMRMKMRRTEATGPTEEAQLAAGCLEREALAQGAAHAQTEGTTRSAGCFFLLKRHTKAVV